MLAILTALKARAMPIGLGVVGGLLAGLYVGAAVSKGHYEARLHEQAVAYANAWQNSLQEYDARSKAEAARAAQASATRAAQSETAAEVIREAANDPDPRDCEWRPDQRLRIEALYGTYGHPTGGPAP